VTVPFIVGHGQVGGVAYIGGAIDADVDAVPAVALPLAPPAVVIATPLAGALALVTAAHAGVGASEAELWPAIGVGAQYARTLTNIAQLAAAGVRVEPYDMYAYGVGMQAWEIDLWGSVKRQVEAAMPLPDVGEKRVDAGLVSDIRLPSPERLQSKRVDARPA
jgi:hypothetical protein